MKADISKMADALRINKGIDAIVHLGGYSVEGPWEAIHMANIVGCYNIFEAARRNKVKRILFATSNATRLGYRPHDNAEDFSREILAKEKPGDPLVEIYQGGLFVAVEEVPNSAAERQGAKK